MLLIFRNGTRAMHRAAASLFALLLCLAVGAQTFVPKGNAPAFVADRRLAGCNYTSYFALQAYLNALGQTELTPTPEGYEPFYVSTYARHGSRFMLKAEQYDAPIVLLREAERKHMLTAGGERLLSDLRRLRSYSTDARLGTLTDVGRRQHRAIAQRLVSHFPEVFQPGADVVALSSHSPRCLQSMAEECGVIDSLMGTRGTAKSVPQLHDIGDMQERLAGAYSSEAMKRQQTRQRKMQQRDINAHTPYRTFCTRLFTRLSWTSVEQLRTFTRDVFHLAQNMQSHDLDLDLWPYFTDAEVLALEGIDNRYWYRRLAPSPATAGILHQRSRPQLSCFLTAADSVVNRRQWRGAHLRFGHDICLLPLACLMQLGTCAAAVADDSIAHLDRQWRCQEMFPMAGNVQLVFYRPTSGDGPVMVKALLNEREVTLPATPVVGPYYRWTEVREQWQKALR